jgi:hypothetical protein
MPNTKHISDAIAATVALITRATAGENQLHELVDTVVCGDSARETLTVLAAVSGALTETVAGLCHLDVDTVLDLLAAGAASDIATLDRGHV